MVGVHWKEMAGILAGRSGCDSLFAFHLGLGGGRPEQGDQQEREGGE
jgi:hypothetical protein